jgi:site-specific recombinase XerD
MDSPSENDAQRRVRELRRLIAGSAEERNEHISKEDRDALIAFDNQMVADRRDANRCGWKHHRNVLEHLFEYAVETNGLAKSMEDGQRGKDGKDELVVYAKENYDNGYTLQAKLSAIRIFAATVLDLDMLPNRFAKIEPSAHVNQDPAPLPSEIVEYDELLRLVKESNLIRDKALISAQWENGPRPMEEMHVLQRENLKIKDEVILITLPRTAGKTERRDLPATASMPYLRRWLQEHPVWDDPSVPINREDNTIEDIPPETYLWTKADKNELLTYNGMAERFNIAGERAGITKQTSPQHLRRSSASIAARQPEIGERDLRLLYDWSRFSISPRHYIAAHGDKTLINVTRARGHKVENFEEDIDTSPIKCTQCHEWTMRGIDNCVHCRYDLTDEQVNIDDVTPPINNPYEGDKRIKEKLVDGDVTASDLEAVRKVQSDIESMGREFFEKLTEWKELAKTLEDANAYAGIEGLAAAAVGHAADTAERSVEAWVELKQKALGIHPGYTLPRNMVPTRRIKVYTAWTVSLVFFVVLMGIDGVLTELAAGDPTEWGTILFAFAALKPMADRAFPSVEEAREAAEKS